LDENPTTEEWVHIEALKEQASGDGRPDKLSLLRQKLSQKAKQEPTFSREPDAGKSVCPVRRGEGGSHRKVFALSPTLPISLRALRLCVE
jgi:hypothetical protein